MAGLDYDAILEAAGARVSATLPDVTVGLEVDGLPAAEMCPFVAIYFEDRRAPLEQQRLAAGRRTDYEIRMTFWSFGFSINSLREAKKLSRDLMRRLEVSLMGDRTLGGTVGGLWLEGGAMDLERGTKGSFLAGTELIVAARAVSAL